MISPLTLIPVVLLLMAVSLGVAFKVRRQALRDWRIVALLAAPAFVMLVLFYSLAIHMRFALGGWPATIGNDGFPPRLLSHAEFTLSCFSVWVFSLLFIWPMIFVTCLSVKRLRKYLLYVGTHALVFLVCLGGMILAPSRFLNWWWD